MPNETTKSRVAIKTTVNTTNLLITVFVNNASCDSLNSFAKI